MDCNCEDTRKKKHTRVKEIHNVLTENAKTRGKKYKLGPRKREKRKNKSDNRKPHDENRHLGSG